MPLLSTCFLPAFQVVLEEFNLEAQSNHSPRKQAGWLGSLRLSKGLRQLDFKILHLKVRAPARALSLAVCPKDDWKTGLA